MDGVSNLHSVWDSVIYQYPGYPAMPLTATDWEWYTTTTETMAATYSFNESDLNPSDFMAWA